MYYCLLPYLRHIVTTTSTPSLPLIKTHTIPPGLLILDHIEIIRRQAKRF